jgi:hypothetical protein
MTHGIITQVLFKERQKVIRIEKVRSLPSTIHKKAT